MMVGGDEGTSGSNREVEVEVEVGNDVDLRKAVTVDITWSKIGAKDSDVADVDSSVTIKSRSSRQKFSFEVVRDSTHEYDEAVKFTLSSAISEVTVDGNRDEYTYTIEDDDDPQIGFAVSEAGHREWDSGSRDVSVVVEIKNGVTLERTVTAQWTLNSGRTTASSSNDYGLPTSRYVYLQTGETSKSFTLSVTGDTRQEDDEKVVLDLGSPHSRVREHGSYDRYTYTIEDNDKPQFKLRALSGSGVESPRTVRVYVDLANSVLPARDVRLNISYSGTARKSWSGRDVDDVPSRMTVPAGSSSASFTFRIVNDSRHESAETAIFDLVEHSSDDAYVWRTRDTYTYTIDANDIPDNRSVASEYSYVTTFFPGASFTRQETTRTLTSYDVNRRFSLPDEWVVVAGRYRKPVYNYEDQPVYEEYTYRECAYWAGGTHCVYWITRTGRRATGETERVRVRPFWHYRTFYTPPSDSAYTFVRDVYGWRTPNPSYEYRRVDNVPVGSLRSTDRILDRNYSTSTRTYSTSYSDSRATANFSGGRRITNWSSVLSTLRSMRNYDRNSVIGDSTKVTTLDARRMAVGMQIQVGPLATRNEISLSTLKSMASQSNSRTLYSRSDRDDDLRRRLEPYN